MNKRSFRIIPIIMLGIVLGNSFSILAFAETPEIYTSKIIPEIMSPGSVIAFQDKIHYTILKGGHYKRNKEQEEFLKEKTADEETLEFECKKNAAFYNAQTEEYPLPQKGTKVVYGTDGLINSIENGKERIAEKIYSNSRNTASKKKKLIAEWGTKKYNKLYKSGSQIIGYGRATTFNDRIGQQDNILKKGDIATKKRWDNCKYGIRVKVKAHKKNSDEYLTHSMYKRDVGGLPNAIVDIWKTGVEYWGYKYSSSLSLAGKTKIVHDDK